ncbi:MAG: M20 family metallopeptidase [Actinomycetota bacterium]
MVVATRPGRVLDHLQQHREDLVGLCEQLVAIESPSDDPGATRLVLERLTSEFHGLGYRCRLSPPNKSGGYLYARPRHHPRGARAQLILGHADTVWPMGTLAARPWTIDGPHAHGPGIFDMKAGLVQIIFALRTLQDLGLEPPATPLVLINTDEEIGSRESRRAIERLSRLACRAFVCEPGLGPCGALKTARKGLGRYTVTVHGRAAHAGLDPEGGASAILELSSVIQQLFALNDRDRDITVNVGTIEGGIQPNVIAPHSQAVVDVRVLNDTDATHVDSAIHAITPVTEGTTISVSGSFGRPPMIRTPGNADLYEQAQDIGGELGLKIREVTAGGGSDGNTTSQHAPTLDGLGIIGDGAHAPSEHIDIASFAPRTALLAALLMQPVNGVWKDAT